MACLVFEPAPFAKPDLQTRVGWRERKRLDMEADTYDYIIVGAGTAGCLLANRLSADPDARVLLLEAGGKDNYHWIHIPVGYLYLMGNPRADWGFKTAAEPGLNGRSLAYPRGRVLGGCSSINGMIYMRGQARDYDLWRQMGNPGWAWDDVLPYFKKHQDQWALEPDAFDGLHARGGEWRIELARIRWEILDAFREAAAEAGIPKVDDFNRGDNEGCGYFHVNQKTGVRWNTSKGFLRPVLHRRNLTVETHAHGRAAGARRQARDGPGHAPAGRSSAPCTARARGDPGGRRHRQPADPAALGHRPGRGAAAARHRGAARAEGRRREPAGPPADPLRLQGRGRQDHERALPEPAAARGLRRRSTC